MDEFEFVLNQLFSAYPHAQITEGTVAVYLRLLRDIPPADLQTVVDQSVAECKFLPSVAELRERWHALTRTLHQMTATDAWGEVKREIRRVGSWGTPTFENPITERVVRNMGWRELCMSEAPEGVDRAQFERAYNELIQRGEQVSKLLPNALEMAERHRGLTQSSPRTIWRCGQVVTWLVVAPHRDRRAQSPLYVRVQGRGHHRPCQHRA